MTAEPRVEGAEVAAQRKIILCRGADIAKVLRQGHGYNICEESRRTMCLE